MLLPNVDLFSIQIVRRCAHLKMSTIRNKRLLRSIEQSQFRQVPVNDLKKLSRAISILQHSNFRLKKILNRMHLYYEKKYKMKMFQLEAALDYKDLKINKLQENCRAEYLFVLKSENHVLIYDDFAEVNRKIRESSDCKVILCRISKAVAIERALIVALAHSRFENYVRVTTNQITFLRIEDIVEFEKDVQMMFV